MENSDLNFHCCCSFKYHFNSELLDHVAVLSQYINLILDSSFGCQNLKTSLSNLKITTKSTFFVCQLVSSAVSVGNLINYKKISKTSTEASLAPDSCIPDYTNTCTYVHRVHCTPAEQSVCTSLNKSAVTHPILIGLKNIRKGGKNIF